MDKQQIGKQLTALREAKGLSKYKVVQLIRANGIKVVQAQILGMERGDTNYTIESLISYLNILEVVVNIENK